MSEFYDNLTDVVQDRAPSTTDAVLNLRTGAYFTAEVETNLDPFTLPEVIAEDPREKIRLHITDDNQAAALLKNDLVQITFGGLKTTFRIVSGYHSVAGIQSQFFCVQVVDGKDQK